MKIEKQQQEAQDRKTAEIILESLETSTAPLTVNWAMEKHYLKAILSGLEKARETRQNG